MLLKCVQLIKSDVLSLQYVIDTCFRKIFNVKSKDVVHECETEFGVYRGKFLVKYVLSDNLLCQVCNNCNDIVCYTVSALLI